MAFADRLRFILEVRKMSQVALAKAVGVESQAVSQWVSRVQPVMPVGARLLKIAEALDVSLPSLMDADDAPIEDMGDLISMALTKEEAGHVASLRVMEEKRRQAIMMLAEAKPPPLPPVGGSVAENSVEDCRRARVVNLDKRKAG